MPIASIPALYPDQRANLGLTKREAIVVVDADLDCVAIAKIALQQLERQLILQPLLDHALERPRPEDRVVALVGELAARRVGQRQRDMARAQQLAQPAELDLDDLSDVRP